MNETFASGERRKGRGEGGREGGGRHSASDEALLFPVPFAVVVAVVVVPLPRFPFPPPRPLSAAHTAREASSGPWSIRSPVAYSPSPRKCASPGRRPVSSSFLSPFAVTQSRTMTRGDHPLPPGQNETAPRRTPEETERHEGGGKGDGYLKKS